MRLLHVFPTFARGGQQMRLAAIAHALGSEFSHSVVSLGADISARDAFQTPIEIEVVAAHGGPGLSPQNIVRLRALICEKKPDILCTYNYGAIEAAVANLIGLNIPHIHFEDGFGADEAQRQNLARVVMRRLVLARSTLVVPSLTLERLALSQWRLPRRRVKRIPNGVDVGRFADASLLRHDGGSVVVGSVGALRPEKNHRRLVGAFSTVGASGASLVVYGDGPERQSLLQMIGDASSRIVFPGETNEPEHAYAQFDVFALSSDTEQAPLSLIEAMAAGLPIVATDVGDIKEMVAESNRNYIVPVKDESGYRRALTRLLSDASLRREIGAANADKARADFDIRITAGRYRELFVATANSASDKKSRKSPGEAAART
jgi:glycosyltransferase involved in cell wall biosynthesis